MKVQNRKKEKSSIYGYLLSAAAMAAVIAISAGAMISFAGRTGSREEENQMCIRDRAGGGPQPDSGRRDHSL